MQQSAHCTLANATWHQATFYSLPCDHLFGVLFTYLWTPGATPSLGGDINGINAMDGMTGFVISLTLTSALAVDVAKALYAQVFCKFGLPRILVVDAGLEFKETFATVLADLLAIPLHIVSP